METTVMTMTQLLENVGEMFESTLGWAVQLVNTITGNPALLTVCIAVPLVGIAIGMLRRLFSLSA